MKELNINEIIRYLVIGIIIVSLVYLHDRQQIGKYLDAFGQLGTLIITFSIGIIFYQFYHSIFYRFLFITLKDLKKQNIRSYIKKNQKFEARWDAENFYSLIRDKCFSENERKVTQIYSPGIHLLYMLSIILGTGAIFNINGLWLLFIIVGIVSYLSGLLTDLTLEKKEWALYNQYEDSTDFKEILQTYQKACDIRND